MTKSNDDYDRGSPNLFKIKQDLIKIKAINIKFFFIA